MAKLRPSAAKIWMECAKSAKLSALVPYVETPFTKKGTNLHAVAANKLLDKYGLVRPKEETTPINRLEQADIDAYLRFVDSMTTDVFEDEIFDVDIEEKLTLEDFLYEGNGVIDYNAYNEDNLLIIDFKSGFKRVYPDDNPQLNIYALAKLYKLEKELNLRPNNIYLAISQPSQNNNRYVKLSRAELIEWLESVRDNIDNAYFEKGEFKVGPHCQFCPARGSCAAHLKQALISNITYEEEDEDA